MNEPTCGDCGQELTLVRPGKHQCDNPNCIQNNSKPESVPSCGDGEKVCDACKVKEPWEHRCFGGDCECQSCLSLKVYSEVRIWLKKEGYPELIKSLSQGDISDMITKFITTSSHIRLIPTKH